MDQRYKSPTTELADFETEYEFRDLGTFTAVLVWMLRAGAVLAAISVWVFWTDIQRMSREPTFADAATITERDLWVTGAAGVLMLATLFIFGRWIVLAHRNLPALGAQKLEFRPGWAVGFFFIPLLNWWKPYQAMRSLWRSSRSVHRPELEESTWVLPAWWTCWVIYSLIGNASWRMRSGGESEMELADNVVYLLLCIMASLVVSRIWQAQEYQRANPEQAPRGFADAPA